MPCRNCASCTATRWRYRVDHAWLGCVVTGLIITADEAAILEKRRCRLLQEDPRHPPPSPTPEAPCAASPIHGRIAVNCRVGMCYMSWVLLVFLFFFKVTSRLEMSRNVTGVQKCGEWPPFFWLSQFFFLVITPSVRVAVHAHIRGHTSMWLKLAVKSPAGIIWVSIPPSPDTNDTLANQAYSMVI